MKSTIIYLVKIFAFCALLACGLYFYGTHRILCDQLDDYREGIARLAAENAILKNRPYLLSDGNDGFESNLMLKKPYVINGIALPVYDGRPHKRNYIDAFNDKVLRLIKERPNELNNEQQDNSQEDPYKVRP